MGLGENYNEPTERKVRVVQVTKGLRSKSYYVKLTGNELNYDVTGELLDTGRVKIKIKAPKIPEEYEVNEEQSQGKIVKEREDKFLKRKEDLENLEITVEDDKKEKLFKEVNCVRRELFVYNKIKLKNKESTSYIDLKEEDGEQYYELELNPKKDKSISFGENTGTLDLLDDLVAYYKMDETTGTTAVDSHGSNNATANNSAVFTSERAGKINTCAEGDGTNYNIDTSILANGLGNNDFSISFWINIDNRTVQRYLVGGYALHTTNTGFHTGVNTNGSIRFTKAGILDVATTGVVVNAGTWYHIVFTVDSSNQVKIYVNNVLSANNTNTTAINWTNTGNLTLFALNTGHTGANLFDGGFDEVAMFSRTLEPNDVDALFNWGDSLSYDDFEDTSTDIDLLNGLKAYYKFDEESGTTAVDSHNSNDMTANNSRVFDTATAGKINTCADFSGGVDLLEGACPDWEIFGDKTFACWLYLISNGDRRPFYSTPPSWGNAFIDLSMGSATSRMAVHWKGTDGVQRRREFPVPPNNVWFHIVVIIRNNDLAVYINNAIVSLTVYTAETNAGNTQPKIAGTNVYGQSGSFLIDEFGIWNRVLTPAERTFVFNNSDGRQYPFEIFYDLNINIIGLGSGTVQAVPDLAQYPAGTDVTLTAIPDDQDSRFKRWLGDVESISNPLNVIITQDYDIDCLFQERGLYNGLLNFEEGDEAISTPIDFNNGEITQCVVEIEKDVDGTLYLTANGTDYEEFTGNPHNFLITGQELRWKFVSTSTGTITKIRVQKT